MLFLFVCLSRARLRALEAFGFLTFIELNSEKKRGQNIEMHKLHVDIGRPRKLYCNKTTKMADAIQNNSLFIIRFIVLEILTYHLLLLV